MPDTPPKRATYATDFVKGDYDTATYLDNVHIDNLMAAFVGLGNEYWVVRRRLMVLEQMLSDAHLVDLAKLEAFVPTEQQKIAWNAERDDFMNRVFSLFTRDARKVPSAMPTSAVPARGTP